ncbi:hypothetical protein LSAT2_009399 [Lamellibrachia satsuma]|nr:hypothetical protein LSAT2_009399 [Lamellibrachia satsuma]
MARSHPANEQRPSRASRATRELCSLFEDLEQPSADCLAEFPAEKERSEQRQQHEIQNYDDHSRNDFTGDVVFRQQALCSRRLPSVLEYVFSMFQHMHKTLLYISR